MNAFLKKLTLMTVGLALILFVGPIISPQLEIQANIWVILIYFYQLTALVHFILLKASQDKSQISISYFITTIVAKLFFSLILVVLMILLVPQDVTITLVAFLAFYLIFTAFEVVSMVGHLKT